MLINVVPKIQEYHLLDCITGMQRFPDKFFDIAIVDPPYGINQGGIKNKTRNRLAGSPNYAYYDDSSGPPPEYFQELQRVSNNQIIFGGNYFTEYLHSTSGWIVWDKCNYESDFSDFEMAWTSFNRGAKIFRYMWNGLFQGRSIKEGHISQGNRKLCEKRIHPSQKPRLLYRWLLTVYLKNYLNKNSIILDTHVGSGSYLCEFVLHDKFFLCLTILYLFA